MTEDSNITASLGVLRGEIEKLQALGLTFATALLRVVEIDLQMRLHNVGEDEIDILSFATNAIEQERYARTSRKTA